MKTSPVSKAARAEGVLSGTYGNQVSQQEKQPVAMPSGSITQYLSLLDEQIVRLNDAIASLGSRLQPLSVPPSDVAAAQDSPTDARSEVALRVYGACAQLECAAGLIDDIRRRIDY